MRHLAPTNGKAAVHALASNTATFQTNQPDHRTELSNPTPEAAERLEALCRQFRNCGLTLSQLSDGLAVTGPGAGGWALPDLRSAALYLRELRRGQA